MRDKPKNHSKKWTNKDIATLKFHVRLGTSTEKIAKVLGRSINAVYSKASKMGIPLKSSSTFKNSYKSNSLNITKCIDIPYNYLNPDLSILGKKLEFIEQSNKPLLQNFDDIECIMKPYNELFKQISDYTKTDNPFKDIINAAFQAQKRLQSLFNQVDLKSNLQIDLNKTNESWYSSLIPTKDVKGSNDIVQRKIKFQLYDLEYGFNLIQSSISKIDYRIFGEYSNLLGTSVSKLQNSINESFRSYGSIITSITKPSELANIPVPQINLIKTEAYLTACLTEKTFSTQISTDKEILKLKTQELEKHGFISRRCIILIEDVYPELLKIYVGAYEAFLGDAIDRKRHVLISLREFWSHLLRHLAPDEEVFSWLQTNKMTNNKNIKKKLTRRERLRFICRNINYKPISNYLNKDIDTFLEYLDLFGRVHEVNHERIREDQLKILLQKSNQYVEFFVDNWKHTNLSLT